jgi:hypothetical protein
MRARKEIAMNTSYRAASVDELKIYYREAGAQRRRVRAI